MDEHELLKQAKARKLAEGKKKKSQPPLSEGKKSGLFSDIVGFMTGITGNKHLREGKSLLAKKDYSRAILAFQTAIKADSQCTLAYNGIAEVLLSKGGMQNTKAAIQQYNKSIEIDPFQFRLYHKIASIYDKLGKAKNAAAERRKMHTAKVLKAQPDNPVANNNMGVLYLQQKDFDKATSYFNRAIKLDPDFQVAFFNLAKVWYQRSMKADQKQADLYLKKSWDYVARGLALGEKAEGILLKAKIAISREQYQKALEFCELAKEMDSSLKEIYATKKAAHEGLMELGEANEAMENYKSLDDAEGGAPPPREED